MNPASFAALWRVFIPTWRFFDHVDHPPRVHVEVDGAWRPALARPPRRWFNLIFNPAGNLHHADENLVARLLAEVAGGFEPGELPSYHLLARRLDPGRAPWRFKIAIDGEDVLVSPEFGGPR